MTTHPDSTLPPQARAAIARFNDRSATVAVVGLGYVGLPLADNLVEVAARHVAYFLRQNRGEVFLESALVQEPDERVEHEKADYYHGERARKKSKRDVERFRAAFVVDRAHIVHGVHAGRGELDGEKVGEEQH